MKVSTRLLNFGGIALATAVGLIAGSHVTASQASGIPATNPFTYSGIVTDDAGGPLHGASVSVAVYDAPTGGTQQCTGASSAMSGNDGRFSIPLAAACTGALSSSTALFVEVAVNSVPIGARTQIGAVPYAAQATTASTISGTISTTQVMTAGGVTVDQLEAPGTIVATAAPSCPAGTVAADGSSLARTGQFAGLFGQIGVTYGSADGAHFSLPDARGVFIRGAGTQLIGGLNFTGTQGVSHADTTKKNGLGLSDGGHHHAIPYTASGNSSPYGTVGVSGSLGNFSASGSGTGSWTSTSDANVSLGGGDSETAPANIAVLYCIRY